MKWLVRIGLGVVALVVVALLVAPMLISTDGLVTKAEAQASRILGREVQIGGVSGVNLFPPRLTISDLSVANEQGFEGEHLVEVAEARFGVKLLPLLSQNVEITTFVLEEPRILLQRKADGSNNWTLGAPDQAPSGEEEEDPASGDAEAPITGTIVVNNGSVRYEEPEASYTASDVDVELVLPPMEEPLTLDGTMMLEGVPAEIALRVAEPWEITAARSSAVEVSVKLARNEVSGTFEALAEPLTLSGPVRIELPDLAPLEPLLGAEVLEAVKPFGAMRLSGTAEATETLVSLAGAEFSTAIASGSGDLNLATSGPRPKLTGNVQAREVDLRPFFPEEEGGTSAPSEGQPFPDWSSEPLDLSGMKAADADVKLGAQKIQLPTYELTNVKATASLAAGLANLKLDSAEALGGNAGGTLRLDARPTEPMIESDFNFTGIDFAEAGPALLGTERLFGSGNLRFTMNTRGMSERDWVNHLTGNASADIGEGRVLGVNLSEIATTGIALVDTIRKDKLTLGSVGTAFTDITSNGLKPGAETQFELADFDVAITDGKVQIGEGKFVADTFRATVGGGVNLPGQGVDMRILLAAKAPDAADYREFKLPVAVGGTFNEPKISIDTKPLAQELARGAATDVLGKAGIDVQEGQSVGEALRERARGELLNVLGGRRKKQEEPKEEGSSEEPPQ